LRCAHARRRPRHRRGARPGARARDGELRARRRAVAGRIVSEPKLHRIRVADSWDETDTLRGVRLDFGELAPQHTRPGQVVKLHAPGHAKRAYFALGNAPRGDGTGELLVKR